MGDVTGPWAWSTKQEFQDALRWLRENASGFSKQIAPAFLFFQIKWGEGDKAHVPDQHEILAAIDKLIDKVEDGKGSMISCTSDNLAILACPSGEKKIVQAGITFSISIHTWIERVGVPDKMSKDT